MNAVCVLLFWGISSPGGQELGCGKRPAAPSTTKLVLPELRRIFPSISHSWTIGKDAWYNEAQSEVFFWSQSTIYRSFKTTLQKLILPRISSHVLIFLFCLGHFPFVMVNIGCQHNYIWKQLKPKQLGISTRYFLD